MKKLLILLIFSVFIFSCNNSKNKEYSALEKNQEANKHPGKKLMETNCYTCHSPSASQEDRIGPPMIAIKKHYLNDDTTKEQFIAAIQSWIKNPNAEDAKMFGAVRRFGVMPKQAYPEEIIKQIADYMYQFDIEQPEWFEDHFNEEKGNQKGKGNRKGKGQGQGQGQGQGMQKQQAQTNFDTLAFCNEKAYPITDSMSVLHNADIKRVSDKPRNQNNQANKKELTYINSFKKDIKNGIEPKPIVDQVDNKVQVYYPITTNTMCLQCHGKPEQDVKRPILEELKKLYPNDNALGYGVNEVRGVWSVTFYE